MKIGIDLGTTYSAAAYLDENGNPHIIPNRDGEPTTPSVVLFEGGSVVVGQEAKDNSSMNPFNVVDFVKRQMGNPNYTFINEADESYTPEDISAIILKRIKADCEAFLNKEIDAAVITVPAYFGDAERKATMDAGRLAGLNVLGVINEPTAAALAFGMSKKVENQLVMIYDLGGGTFDVTLVKISNGQFEVKATHGDKQLGGFNFDNEMMMYVQRCVKDETGVDIDDDPELMQDIRIKCEKAKRALSARTEYSFTVKAGSKGVKVRITRQQFEELIRPVIEATEVSIDVVMDESGISAKDIDKVLLVGGSTRVPAVREFVQKKLNIVPSTEVNPDEAVAIGAAYYVNDLDTPAKSEVIPIAPPSAEKSSTDVPAKSKGAPVTSSSSKKRFTDVNSHGLGVAIRDSASGEMINSIIIPRNTKLPVQMENVYATSVDNQTMIRLSITEGDETDLRYVNQIGVTEVPISPRPVGSPIKIGFNLDENAIIHVYMIDLVDQRVLCESVVERNANLSDEELAIKEQRMNNIDPQ